MLTNTAPAHTAARHEITAATIAIEDVERRWRAALRDVARLAAAEKIADSEAAELEAGLAARFTARARALELHGADITTPAQWARYEARAARRRAEAAGERRRSPRLRCLGPSARRRREREMCVVASARVSADILRGLSCDDDDETLALRRELAAAGLL